MGHYAANGRTITACGEKCAANHEGGKNSNNSDETTCRRCKAAIKKAAELDVPSMLRICEDYDAQQPAKAQAAVEKAQLLASCLGPKWKPRVNANLGWYWSAVSGEISVSPSIDRSRDGGEKITHYYASYDFGIQGEGKTPIEALNGMLDRYLMQKAELSEKIDAMSAVLGARAA